MEVGSLARQNHRFEDSISVYYQAVMITAAKLILAHLPLHKGLYRVLQRVTQAWRCMAHHVAASVVYYAEAHLKSSQYLLLYSVMIAACRFERTKPAESITATRSGHNTNSVNVHAVYTMHVYYLWINRSKDR